jgi:hypothetical protein
MCEQIIELKFVVVAQAAAPTIVQSRRLVDAGAFIGSNIYQALSRRLKDL